MDKIEPLIVELLTELDNLSPEQIKKFNIEWLAELKNKKSEVYERAERFVNAVCETAVDRVTRRMQTV